MSFQINTGTSKLMNELSEVFIASIPRIADAGMLCSYMQVDFIAHARRVYIGVRGYALWTPPNTFFGMFLQPNGRDIQVLNDTLQPVWDWTTKHPGTAVATTPTIYPSFFSYAQTYTTDMMIATNIRVGSRLVSRDALQKSAKQLAKFTVGENLSMGASALIGKYEPTLPNMYL